MITQQLMSAANAAIAQTSPPYPKGDLTTFSVQFTFSDASLAGDVTLECSNNNTNWILVAGSTVAIAAGEGAMINVTNGGYRYIRAKWAPSAGTGTVTATLVVLEPANRY